MADKVKASADIHEWDVEDEQFWESTGKKVATLKLRRSEAHLSTYLRFYGKPMLWTVPALPSTTFTNQMSSHSG